MLDSKNIKVGSIVKHSASSRLVGIVLKRSSHDMYGHQGWTVRWFTHHRSDHIPDCLEVLVP